MQIGSLITEALLKIQNIPLNHYQSNLIPGEEYIPDFNSVKECPDTLYPVGKPPFPLIWNTLATSFSFQLNKEFDQEAFIIALHSSIELLQSQINEAIKTASGKICLLSWVGKLYRIGFGDYDTENGGYGSIVDPRTSNKYGIYCCRVDGYLMMDLTFTFSIVNI